MGLPDACLAHVEGLSFPWLWPKLVMSASISQSKIFTVVQHRFVPFAGDDPSSRFVRRSLEIDSLQTRSPRG